MWSWACHCTVVAPAKVRCLTAPILAMFLQNFRESVVTHTLTVLKLAWFLRLQGSISDKNPCTLICEWVTMTSWAFCSCPGHPGPWADLGFLGAGPHSFTWHSPLAVLRKCPPQLSWLCFSYIHLQGPFMKHLSSCHFSVSLSKLVFLLLPFSPYHRITWQPGGWRGKTCWLRVLWLCRGECSYCRVSSLHMPSSLRAACFHWCLCLL